MTPAGPGRGQRLIRRLAERHGTDLRLLEYYRAGNGGAWRVADRAGRVFVMSSVAGDDTGRAAHARSMSVLERLWSIGHPVPRYEQVHDLGEVLVILQTEARGVKPKQVTRGLIDRLIELQIDRTSLMDDDSDAGPLALQLAQKAATHQLLADHSDRTRDLLEWIEAVGDSYGDTLPGLDAVHFDYQPGNILVHPDRPDEIVAIVDWDGAVATSGGFDLVTLAWNASGPAWNSNIRAADELWTLVRQLPDNVLVPSSAHMCLRFIAWCIRSAPQYLDQWLEISERLAANAGRN